MPFRQTQNNVQNLPNFGFDESVPELKVEKESPAIRREDQGLPDVTDSRNNA